MWTPSVRRGRRVRGWSRERLVRSDEVWFAIPSASVDRCRARLGEWRSMGYRVAVLQNRERGEIVADRVVWCDTYPGWSESVNILCRGVVPREAPVVVTGGDDMLPDPNHDADELLKLFRERFPDGFGVMQPTGDPHMNAREYCGSPWLGRAWIEEAYGGRGPMFGGYRHNWADHELHWVARGLGALAEEPEIRQAHEHFTRTGEAAPSFWADTVAASDRSDVELFISRLWQGFPGHAPLGGRRGCSADWWRERYPGLAERYWATRYGKRRLAESSERAMRDALQHCADRGLTTVVIYGAGTETRSAAGALMEPPVEVVGVIDDDARMTGRRLWGYTIETMDQATARGLAVDAVLISSRSCGDSMERSAAALAGRGAHILHVGAPAHQGKAHV